MAFLHRLNQFLLSSTFGKTLLIRRVHYCWLAGLLLSYWLSAARGMELNVPSWSELRAKHAVLISKIDSDISCSRRETNRLRQQNALKRQQLERFDRAFVV